MTSEEFDALKIREGWVPAPASPPEPMTLQELAALIVKEGREPASYFTVPAHDGSRRSVFNQKLSAADYHFLLSLVRGADDHGQPSPDQVARNRARLAHDAAVRRN